MKTYGRRQTGKLRGGKRSYNVGIWFRQRFHIILFINLMFLSFYVYHFRYQSLIITGLYIQNLYIISIKNVVILYAIICDYKSLIRIFFLLISEIHALSFLVVSQNAQPLHMTPRTILCATASTYGLNYVRVCQIWLKMVESRLLHMGLQQSVRMQYCGAESKRNLLRYLS